MRVMVIIKANADSEAGVMPSEEVLAEMGKFNEELVNAGIWIEARTAPARRSKVARDCNRAL